MTYGEIIFDTGVGLLAVWGLLDLSIKLIAFLYSRFGAKEVKTTGFSIRHIELPDQRKYWRWVEHFSDGSEKETESKWEKRLGAETDLKEKLRARQGTLILEELPAAQFLDEGMLSLYNHEATDNQAKGSTSGDKS